MPCNDGGWGDEVRVSRDSVTEHRMLAASMCGLLTQLEKEGVIGLWLSSVDWAEAGIKRKTLETWWKAHKREDAARLAREAAEKRKDDLRKIAIGKLSPDELEALGIKW
jgi:hypothetical protein